ncbi:MAG: hypothetical protein ACRDMH_00775 [Solirubrobacterales bacterium]
MHGSLWRFRGNPDELLESYRAILTEIPAENMRLHLCLRTPDGIIIVDTCPSRKVFEGFVAGTIRELGRRHGLPDPESLDDFPVQAAFVDGERRE